MSKKIKQINFDEALKLYRAKKKVFALDLFPTKPVIKNIDNITFSDVLQDDKYIFVVVEEA